jgi:tetratricopeptide (TPR) repeat protein
MVAALLVGGGCKDKAGSSTTATATATTTTTTTTTTAEAGTTAEAVYEKAKLELDNKAYAAAVADFTRATTSASDPDLRANAWLGLGAAYGELGDHTRAVAAYEQVTVLRPDDADAWRVLAEGMAAAGKRDRQAAALEHVIALDADDLSAYLDLAGVDVAIGKTDRSKDVYLRYEGRRREALVQLGKSKEPEARIAAAEALGGARDAGTARALVLALTDKEPAVRVACAQSLGRIGVDIDPDVRPALQAMLKKELDPKVRASVDDALATAH